MTGRGLTYGLLGITVAVAVAAPRLGSNAHARETPATTFWATDGHGPVAAVTFDLTTRPLKGRAVLPGRGMLVGRESVSPDGRLIGAARHMRGRGELILAPTARAPVRVIATTIRRYTAPVFSPGGRWLAATEVGGRCGDTNTALVVADVVGGTARSIVLPPPRRERHGPSPRVDVVEAISPDGRQVVIGRTWGGEGACGRFAETSGSGEIVDTATGSTVELADHFLRGAEWSPDGSRLAWTVGDSGGCEMDVARGDGRSPRTIAWTDHPRDPRLDCWSNLPFEWTRRNLLLFTRVQALWALDGGASRPHPVFVSPQPLENGCPGYDGCPAELYGLGSRSSRVIFIAKPNRRAERWFLVDPQSGDARRVTRPALRSASALLAVRQPEGGWGR